MNSPRPTRFAVATAAALLGLVTPPARAADPAPAPATPIVLGVDGITAVRNLPVLLAERLGYFRAAGLAVTLRETAVSPEVDRQLVDGRLAAMVAYYHHTIVAQVEEKIPATAIITLAVTPGYKVLLATPLQAVVRSPADLKGRRIISGGPHSAKTTSANWLVLHAGFALADYTRLSTGDKAQIAAALKNGEADLVIAPEPDAGHYVAQGVAVPFLDLYSVEGTRRAVGSLFPTTVVYMAAAYAEAHPALAQKLAGAFARTLQFINTHAVAEIAALVPEFATDKNASPAVLHEGVKMFATDGRMPAAAARAEAAVLAAQFPDYRAAVLAETFTDRYLDAALAPPRP